MFWKQRRDEDDVDRVNRIWTVLLLGVATVATFTYIAIFPKTAITCSPRDQINKRISQTMLQHATEVCLEELEPATGLGDNVLDGRHKKRLAHNYVPLCLAFQLIGFLFPFVFARYFLDVLGTESVFQFMMAEKKDVATAVNFHERPRKLFYRIFIIKKYLYLINSSLQVYFVSKVLRPHPKFRGVHIQDSMFPHSVTCRVTLSTNITTLYDCALHVHSVHSKLYVFLFCWLVLVSIINLISLITWTVLVNGARLATKKIQMYILPTPDCTIALLNSFVKDYLGKDYILYILLVQSMHREIFVAELTSKHWQRFIKQCPVMPTTQAARPIKSVTLDPTLVSSLPIAVTSDSSSSKSRLNFTPVDTSALPTPIFPERKPRQYKSASLLDNDDDGYRCRTAISIRAYVPDSDSDSV